MACWAGGGEVNALARELRAMAAHLFDRLEEAATAPDPAILEHIALEAEGAAGILRRMAAAQRGKEFHA